MSHSIMKLMHIFCIQYFLIWTNSMLRTKKLANIVG